MSGNAIVPVRYIYRNFSGDDSRRCSDFRSSAGQFSCGLALTVVTIALIGYLSSRFVLPQKVTDLTLKLTGIFFVPASRP